MAGELTFNLAVNENGKEIYSASLGYEALANIVNNYSDEERSNDFFKLAAQYPASSVREAVASKNALSDGVAELLSRDASINVLRKFTSYSDAFCRIATDELLERYLKLGDGELARNIAQRFHACRGIDTGKIVALLKKAPDPEVRRALADNPEIPVEIIMNLLEDADATVREMAQYSLRNR